MGERELFALLCLLSWCLMIVAILLVCLQFVIVVFPDKIYLLFYGKVYWFSKRSKTIRKLFKTMTLAFKLHLNVYSHGKCTVKPV